MKIKTRLFCSFMVALSKCIMFGNYQLEYWNKTWFFKPQKDGLSPGQSNSWDAAGWKNQAFHAWCLSEHPCYDVFSRCFNARIPETSARSNAKEQSAKLVSSWNYSKRHPTKRNRWYHTFSKAVSNFQRFFPTAAAGKSAATFSVSGRRVSHPHWWFTVFLFRSHQLPSMPDKGP